MRYEEVLEGKPGFVIVCLHGLATDKEPFLSVPAKVPSMRSGTRINVSVAAATAWIRSWLPTSELPNRSGFGAAHRAPHVGGGRRPPAPRCGRSRHGKRIAPPSPPTRLTRLRPAAAAGTIHFDACFAACGQNNSEAVGPALRKWADDHGNYSYGTEFAAVTAVSTAYVADTIRDLRRHELPAAVPAPAPNYPDPGPAGMQ